MREKQLARAGLAGSIIAAFAASICCIGPIAAAFLGFSSLGALLKFETYRPLFSGAALVFLGSAFYMTYRRKPAESCQPGSICAVQGPDRMQRINKAVLWVITAIALIVLTFPTWSNWVLG